jgi:hypothetical protein
MRGDEVTILIVAAVAWLRGTKVVYIAGDVVYARPKIAKSLDAPTCAALITLKKGGNFLKDSSPAHANHRVFDRYSRVRGKHGRCAEEKLHSSKLHKCIKRGGVRTAK